MGICRDGSLVLNLFVRGLVIPIRVSAAAKLAPAEAVFGICVGVVLGWGDKCRSATYSYRIPFLRIFRR